MSQPPARERSLPKRREIVLPDLGLGDAPIVLTVWLVDTGTRVLAGDRVAEVLVGNAVVDLPSPTDGVLTRKRVGPDERVYPGQSLGEVAEDE